MQLTDRLGGVGLDRVSHCEYTHNLVVPADEYRRAAPLLQLRGRRSKVLRQQQIVLVDELAPPDQHRPTVDLGPHPVPRDVGERRGGRNLQSSLARTGDDSRADRVFGARFHRGSDPEHQIRLAPFAGNNIGELHLGAGEGAGLVEHHGVDLL